MWTVAELPAGNLRSLEPNHFVYLARILQSSSSDCLVDVTVSEDKEDPNFYQVESSVEAEEFDEPVLSALPSPVNDDRNGVKNHLNAKGIQPLQDGKFLGVSEAVRQ
jgi:hypothetical protein